MNLLETIIATFFKRKIKERIEPIGIGRALLKAMAQEKRSSISRTYVPNQYIVSLHPAQLADLKCMRNTLIDELTTVLKEKADQEDWHFIGPLTIDFYEKDPEQDIEVKVEAFYVENNVNQLDNDRKMEYNNNEIRCETLRYDISALNNGKSEPRLVVEIGNSDVCSVLLRDGLLIGRSSECDLRLDDGNVSRIHAKIFQKDNQWVLKDNQSTNGIYVNGEKIDERILKNCDKIQIGTSVLAFKVDQNA